MISRFMRKTIYIIIRLKEHITKRMHPTLLKISQENDKVFLKILSKNSELKYLEVKHRKIQLNSSY